MDAQRPDRPRLLIVAALFSPSRLIGARRPERMAKHLPGLGWDVSVLTLHPRYMKPIDPACDPPQGAEIIRTHTWMPGSVIRSAAGLAGRATGRRDAAGKPLRPGGSGRDAGAPPGSSPAKLTAAEPVNPSRPAQAGGRSSTEPSGPQTPENAPQVRGPLDGLERLFWRGVARWEFPDPWFAWRLFAPAAVRGRHFDVVLATIPPYTPALIARDIARRTGARLVIDYRDPWLEAPNAGSGKGWYEGLLDRHRRAEDACLMDAELVLGVSPTICRRLATRTDTRILLIPNSFEPGEAPAPPAPGGPARLVYAGSLAYGRNLDPLLAAMASVSRDYGPERLRLDYAGPQGEQVLAQAGAMGVSRYVRDLGNLGAPEARAAIVGALAGVVLVSREYEYSLPGKIFDILAAGRPILLIAPSQSDSADLVRRHRLGWCHEPADIQGLAASLRSALAGEIPRPEGLEQLQTVPLMRVLDRELRRLIGPPH